MRLFWANKQVFFVFFFFYSQIWCRICVSSNFQINTKTQKRRLTSPRIANLNKEINSSRCKYAHGKFVFASVAGQREEIRRKWVFRKIIQFQLNLYNIWVRLNFQRAQPRMHFSFVTRFDQIVGDNWKWRSLSVFSQCIQSIFTSLSSEF